MGTGIPVPPTIPDGSKAFTVCVPDDPFFYGVVMGLLKQATFKYFWAGTDEQKTAVTERMLEMYYGYQDQAGCMDCDQIADCIENDAATQAAIAEAITTNSIIQQAIQNVYNPLQQGGNMPETVRGESVTGSNPGCNLDKLWGWIDGGIEGMNAQALDAQQAAEAKTNVFERISTIVSAIPGLGELPVDEIINYVQGLWTDDLFENYEANDTVGYRNELKCDIFCLARDNGCAVTMDLLFEYFKNRLLYSGEDVLEDIVNYLVLGTWEGTQVCDVFYFMQLVWLRWGNRFFPILGLTGIATLFQLGEPNDDWILLCDCPVVCDAYDFRTEAYSPPWAIRMVGATPLAVYAAGVGYAPVEAGTGNFQSQVYIIGGLDCAAVEIVYTCPETPEQAQLAWIDPTYSVYVPFASLTLASGTHTETVDLTAYTPAPGATGIGLVSGNSVGDIDNVVTWQQANFS